MKKRWDTLDILKCLCAFGVIGIHRGFPGDLGTSTKLLFRGCVPLFFLISGFFYCDILAEKREKQQIVKIFRLNLEASLFYLCWGLGEVWYEGNGQAGMISQLQTWFSPENIRDFLLANESALKLHLWYLSAFLYVLIFAAHFSKKKRMGVLAVLAPFLLAGDWIFGKYSVYLWSQEIDYVYVRNYLFVGIPFFTIGYLIGCKRDWLMKKLNSFWMGLFFLGAVFFYRISAQERAFLREAESDAERQHYIGTTFMAICIFFLFLAWEKYRRSRILLKPLAWIGKRYSTLIYILHPAFMDVLGYRYPDESVPGYELYMRWRPCWIFLATLSFVAVWCLILDGIKWVRRVISEKRQKKLSAA